MKTKKEILQDIKAATKDAEQLQKEGEFGKAKRVLSRIAIMRKCIQYLETSQRPDFVVSEIARVQKRLDAFADHISALEQHNEGRALPTTFLKELRSEFGITEIRAQAKVLQYIAGL